MKVSMLVHEAPGFYVETQKQVLVFILMFIQKVNSPLSCLQRSEVIMDKVAMRPSSIDTFLFILSVQEKSEG